MLKSLFYPSWKTPNFLFHFCIVDASELPRMKPFRAKLAPLGAYEVRMHGISHLRWLIKDKSSLRTYSALTGFMRSFGWVCTLYWVPYHRGEVHAPPTPAYGVR